MPKVRFFCGVVAVVPFHVWEIEEEDSTVMTVSQIPLKPAYAISVHHSQGMSVDCAEIDLSDVFEYGQAYVALSRVRSIEGLTLSGLNIDLIQAHPKALEFYRKLEEKEAAEEGEAATTESS